jgi:lipoate-protein ligase A
MPIYDPPIHCRLLIDPASGGAWQMAVDEALLETAAAGGGATLRFYEWSEPTLSLGYFQQVAERSSHRATRDCPLVRRQTGGGAILHDVELTYSLAVADDRHGLGDATRLYDVVHTSLVDVLAGLGVDARLNDCLPGRPDDRTTLTRDGTISRNCNNSRERTRAGQREPFLCFQRRARADVLVGESKVCGSAQRRHGTAVLQHGSLLLAASELTPELPGLKELTGKSWSLAFLRDSWTRELAARLGLKLVEACLSAAELDRARTLAVERYDAGRWNRRR